MNARTDAPWRVRENVWRKHPEDPIGEWLVLGAKRPGNNGIPIVAEILRSKQDALLIAAAPDLLATLEWVRANYAGGSTREINARIDAAISKATSQESSRFRHVDGTTPEATAPIATASAMPGASTPGASGANSNDGSLSSDMESRLW